MMLTSPFLITLAIALDTVLSTPLGDRSLAARHPSKGVQITRRVFVDSQAVQAPPACAALNAAAANSTSTPPVSSTLPTSTYSATAAINTTIPLPIIPINDSSFPVASASASGSLPSPSTSSPPNNGAHISSRPGFARHLPLSKRIAQPDLPTLAQTWQSLCLASNSSLLLSPSSDPDTSYDPDTSPCVTLAGLSGLSALLANAPPCAQQDIADSMIDFAYSPGVLNKAQLIAYAISYRRHPRNALNVLGIVPSTLYCTKRARNKELWGVVNKQLDGVDRGVFGGPREGLVSFGGEGTCPFGLVPDMETCQCVEEAPTTNEEVPEPTGTAPAPTPTTGKSGDDTSVNGDGSSSSLPEDSDSTPPLPSTTTPTSTSPNSDSDADSDSDSDNTPDAPLPDVTAVVANPESTTTKTKTPGPVFQPDDISGDVNDPNGRRRR